MGNPAVRKVTSAFAALLAAGAGRVLVSRDARTMLAHFQRFVAGNESPGLKVCCS
jgi:phosphomannomutase